MVLHYSAIFLAKIYNFHVHTYFTGIWIWTVENLGSSHHASVVRVPMYVISNNQLSSLTFPDGSCKLLQGGSKDMNLCSMAIPVMEFQVQGYKIS